MKNDLFKHEKKKFLAKDLIDLPDFLSPNHHQNQVSVVEGTNVIRVPFGIRSSKKKRPQKTQNIATLILPITSVGNPTPPPYVA